jgi:peptidoglycan/LPS O-acetylase OafA/YrhL
MANFSPERAGAPGHDPLLRAHMPELDSARGLAVLGVLFYHCLYWARDLSMYTSWQQGILRPVSVGQFGVNLFFVLSGFLITGILLDSRERSDYFQRFYYRRALRILPAYYLTLVLLILFGLTSRGFLLTSLFYSSNLSPLFGISLSYPVLWSLAVEEHFYLAWPAAARYMSSSLLLRFLLGIIILSPVSRLLYQLHAVRSNTIGAGFGFYTWNNLDGLALGAIVAILLRKPTWTRERSRLLSMGLFALALAIGLIGMPLGILSRKSAFGEGFQCVPWNLIFGGFLVALMLAGCGKWKSLATPALLIFFGRISYGLYLYHLMVLKAYDEIDRRTHWVTRMGVGLWQHVWLRTAVVCLAATAVSWLSRRYFEEPFLRLKDRSLRDLLSSRAASEEKDSQKSNVVRGSKGTEPS